jgi:DNA polymerase-3 subunit delta'
MVFGYDDKIEFFKKLIEEDDLAHAYLFYGEPETGKFSFASFLSRFLENPESPDDTGILLDTLIVRNEEGGTLGIDDVLRVQEFLYQRPLISKRRTVIVDDASSLTREAQGALLKIVEEPPQSSLIIFVSSDKNDLFDALLSRVEKIYFPTLSSAIIEEGLNKLYRLDKGKTEKVAAVSFGRFGRAVTIATGKSASVAEEGDEEDLLKELSDAIMKLYRGGVVKNQKLLSWLLEREVFIKRYKRYNLNMKLQKKAVDAVLQKMN